MFNFFLSSGMQITIETEKLRWNWDSNLDSEFTLLPFMYAKESNLLGKLETHAW